MAANSHDAHNEGTPDQPRPVVPTRKESRHDLFMTTRSHAKSTPHPSTDPVTPMPNPITDPVTPIPTGDVVEKALQALPPQRQATPLPSSEPLMAAVRQATTEPIDMPSLEELKLPSMQGTDMPPLEELKLARVQGAEQKQGTLNPVPAVPTSADQPHPTLLVQTLRAKRQRKLRVRHLARKRWRQTRTIERRTAQRFWITILSMLLAFLVIFLSLSGAGAFYTYRYVTQIQTTYAQQVLSLRDLLPLDNLKMYDSKGVLIDQLTDNGIHTTVALDQVASPLLNATVATEDRYFWTNQGFDITGMVRAALHDLQNGRIVEGGSTITQQLVKRLILGNETTLTRKVAEVILAPQVNNHYNKRDILEMYLNSIYYGHQAYGADAAATVYFGLEDTHNGPAAAQLDLAQAAILAGIPSNPSAYDPLLHPQAAFNRFATILGLMEAQHYITRVQALDAIHEEQGGHFFKSAASLRNRAPHFVNFVLGQLQQMFHLKRNQLSRSGLIVNTTLDINLQDKIQKIAQQHIAELRYTHNVSNAAEVLIDFHTGAILSLLGSINYNDSSIDGQFDVATQGYRQPGSSFKPYVYVTAFSQGASPAQAINDAPLTIQLPYSNPPTFSPTNYDLRYHGQMTLRCALQNSLNVPGVKVLQHAGIDNAMQMAYNMGITSYQGTPGYSLVLGGLGVRLIDHTSAMGTLANGGVHVPDYAISKVISGSTGKLLYQHQRTPGKPVISPQLAYMMTNVLSDNTDRIPEFYDCNVLQLYTNSQTDCWYGNRGVVRPAAAKTGTTNDFRDNWTVGYTTDYVMGVWAGNDNNTPMYDVTGVHGAAPIWHDSMLVAEQGHPVQDFTNPGGLERQEVTYPDGVQTTDWFLPGTAPVFTPTPTPTPTMMPTATQPSGTPTATPTTGPTVPTPPKPSQPIPHAYCPSSYTFAFAPPTESGPNPGWW